MSKTEIELLTLDIIYNAVCAKCHNQGRLFINFGPSVWTHTISPQYLIQTQSKFWWISKILSIQREHCLWWEVLNHSQVSTIPHRFIFLEVRSMKALGYITSSFGWGPPLPRLLTTRSSCSHLHMNSSSLGTKLNVTIPGQNYKCSS